MLNDLFADALQRATEKRLPVIELLSLVHQLEVAGQTALVRALYLAWLENNKEDPLLYAMYFNFGVVLSNVNDLAGAQKALEESIRLNPDFIPPYINLGHQLERAGRTGDGVQQWYAVVNKLGAVNGENIGFRTEALKQIGRVLERAYIDSNAEEALRLSLDINQNQSDVVQHYISLRMRNLKWPVIEPWGKMTKKALLEGISSLSLAAYTDDPLLQLANAYLFAKRTIGRPKVSFADNHEARKAEPMPRKLRIGYLSSDLREHAIGFLMSEIFELHDRSKVEPIAYYCGHEVDDRVYKRFRASAENWVNITPMSDTQAAERIVADKVDILVDINGYTMMARTAVLSMRPAPIIVNWLGFPGTLGTPYHHYIIGDDFITPPGTEHYYSEKVVRLPCYQPNDRKREVAQHVPTRAEAALPDNAVVFCCFNGIHKITKFVWMRWMEILKRVPNSVLWLLDSSEPINARLKALAGEHGVVPERIVFAVKLRNQEHLSRYPLADIFLDTSPYGAHTTCSDALWMGVPVLTLPGRGFAARVCGSLVTSAGVPELICKTPDDYVARAVELANDPAQRAALRRKLLANRDSSVLFNTPLLVSSLEGLYAGMWHDFTQGKLPRPDFSNLEAYSDAGIDIDDNNVELLAVPNYEELYRQRLADMDSFSYLPPDKRLWRGTGAR